MTLLVAVATTEMVALLSDRRSTGSGKIIDSDLNKVGVLQMRGVRLVYAFTGLASVGTFTTHNWLCGKLVECAAPDFDPVSTLQRVARAATETFRTHPALSGLTRAQKLLTIVVIGFIDGDRPIGCARITNSDDAAPHQSVEDFRCGFRQFPGDAHETLPFTWFAGNTTSVRPTDRVRLEAMLNSSRPPRSLLFFTVKLMREIAARPGSRGTIGSDIMSVLMLRNQCNIESLFHSSRNRSDVFMPAFVVATEAQQLALNNFQFSTPGHRRSGPDPRKSAPCECGSGRKFRKCCGRKYMQLMRRRRG